MEADGFWMVDGAGAEMPGVGLNAVLSDYARLGCCYLGGGAWNGAQIVPRAWALASVTPDRPHLRPGARDSAERSLGYGYQWWAPDDSGAYSAIGVYNQFVWVDPATRTVVAETSAFRGYASTATLESYRVADHFALFVAVARRG